MFLGLLDEFSIQLRVTSYEWHVHQRAIVWVNVVFKQLGVIQTVVQQLGLLAVASVHGLNAALFIDPFQNEPGNIDLEDRRRVERGLFSGLLGVVEHAWQSLDMTQQRFFQDYDRYASGSQILLGTSIHQIEFFKRVVLA